MCLAIHHANTKKLSQKRKSLTGNNKISQEEVLMRIKNNSIESLIFQIAQLGFNELNFKIEPLVAFSFLQLNDKSENSLGFLKILETLGDPKEITQKYES